VTRAPSSHKSLARQTGRQSSQPGPRPRAAVNSMADTSSRPLPLSSDNFATPYINWSSALALPARIRISKLGFPLRETLVGKIHDVSLDHCSDLAVLSNAAATLRAVQRAVPPWSQRSDTCLTDLGLVTSRGGLVLLTMFRNAWAARTLAH